MRKGETGPTKIQSGDRFGRLVVIKRVANSYRNTMFLCCCDCGIEKTVSAGNMMSGATKSCGCYRASCRLFPDNRAKSDIFSELRTNARSRNQVWELSKPDFERLTQGPCAYCGTVKSNSRKAKNGPDIFAYNGIDRVDNELGYTISNSVSCCKLCNRGKNDSPKSVFLDWIKRVYEFSSSSF